LVAVKIEAARRALGKLDHESRALLDLSLRRGLEDEDIANVLRVDTDEVKRRRDAIIEQLASDLGLSTRDERDELFATLPDLPPEAWRGS
jgi:DNA-directed RNA polymerase specialized sigma24 family protein